MTFPPLPEGCSHGATLSKLCWGWQFLSTWFVCFSEFQHFLSKYCFYETCYICAGQLVTPRNEEQWFLALTSMGGRSIVSMVLLVFLPSRALVGTGSAGMSHKGRLYFQGSSHRGSQWRPGAALIIRLVFHADISEECRLGPGICRMPLDSGCLICIWDGNSSGHPIRRHAPSFQLSSQTEAV